MLRQKDGLPELPGPMLGGKGFALYVNDTRVQPRLPCVWSVSRSVDYRGTEIPAVMEISRELKPGGGGAGAGLPGGAVDAEQVSDARLRCDDERIAGLGTGQR